MIRAIDTRPMLAALEQAPGEEIAVSKTVMREFLAEIARGQSAQRTLIAISSMAITAPGCAA